MKVHNYIIMGWCGVLLLALVGCGTKPAKDNAPKAVVKQLYHCSMHPEVVRDKPGSCPICGMDLVPFSSEEKAVTEVDLNTLLRPANSATMAAIPVLSVEQKKVSVDVDALGTIQYDTREIGGIAARVSGRIEKLYLRATFENVVKGQKVMDIYSPELLTAQQDLLFLLKNDAANATLIAAAKEKLLLLGMSSGQLEQMLRSQKPVTAVTVYSNYNGHIHDALSMGAPMATTAAEPLLTRELALKEGMYVQKGQTVLTVMDPSRLWVVLNIDPANQSLVRVGDPVKIISEAMPEMDFRAKINFIEPFYREDSKTITARVYFENHSMNMPVGSQVRATISTRPVDGAWLPGDAVLSLGVDKVVFKKDDAVFRAQRVETGISHDNRIQITGGLTATDTVAANAQFLMDSESFIKINQ